VNTNLFSATKFCYFSTKLLKDKIKYYRKNIELISNTSCVRLLTELQSLGDEDEEREPSLDLLFLLLSEECFFDE